MDLEYITYKNDLVTTELRKDSLVCSCEHGNELNILDRSLVIISFSRRDLLCGASC
jgi:hypothetical protein